MKQNGAEAENRPLSDTAPLPKQELQSRPRTATKTYYTILHANRNSIALHLLVTPLRYPTSTGNLLSSTVNRTDTYQPTGSWYEEFPNIRGVSGHPRTGPPIYRNSHGFLVSLALLDLLEGKQTDHVPKIPGSYQELLSLGLQVYKYYLLWALKYIDMTYFGLFGAPGFQKGLKQVCLFFDRGPQEGQPCTWSLQVRGRGRTSNSHPCTPPAPWRGRRQDLRRRRRWWASAPRALKVCIAQTPEKSRPIRPTPQKHASDLNKMCMCMCICIYIYIHM